MSKAYLEILKDGKDGLHQVKRSIGEHGWFDEYDILKIELALDLLENNIKPIPTLDELREEIIDGLIERYRNVARYEIIIDGKSYIIRNTKKNNNKYMIKLSQIELDLAHKITTYFMRLEESNENI